MRIWYLNGQSSLYRSRFFIPFNISFPKLKKHKLKKQMNSLFVGHTKMSRSSKFTCIESSGFMYRILRRFSEIASCISNEQLHLKWLKYTDTGCTTIDENERNSFNWKSFLIDFLLYFILIMKLERKTINIVKLIICAIPSPTLCNYIAIKLRKYFLVS